MLSVQEISWHVLRHSSERSLLCPDAKTPESAGRRSYSNLLGTGTMLLGNVVEFWVSEHPGWVMMGVRSMMLPPGFVLLGIGTLRARVFTGWRRTVPFAFGLLLAAIKLITVLGVHYWLLDGSDAVGIALGWMALGYALWSEHMRYPAVASRVL